MGYRPKGQRIINKVHDSLKKASPINRAQLNFECMKNMGASPKQVTECLDVMQEAGVATYDDEFVYLLDKQGNPVNNYED